MWWKLFNPHCWIATENSATPYFVSTAEFALHVAGFLLGIFSGGQNLLLCYCFRTKFQGGAKVFRGQTASGGAPLSKKASVGFLGWCCFLHFLRIDMMIIFSIICSPIISYQLYILCVSHYNFNVSSSYTLLFIWPHCQQKLDLHQWGKGNIMSKK